MDVRRANDRIAEKAEQLRFVSRVPMLCECSAPDCRTVVLVGLDEREDGKLGQCSGMTPEPAIRAGLDDWERLPERSGNLAGMKRLWAAASDHFHHRAEVTP